MAIMLDEKMERHVGIFQSMIRIDVALSTSFLNLTSAHNSILATIKGALRAPQCVILWPIKALSIYLYGIFGLDFRSRIKDS